MNFKRLVSAFGLIVALLLVIACKARTPGQSETKSVEIVSSALFVGCAPSAGECKHSCPENDGRGDIDDRLCFDSIAPYACFCPSSSVVKVEPPSEDSHRFVGCVPTPSECRYSCNRKGIVTFQGSPLCEVRQFACYCELDSFN